MSERQMIKIGEVYVDPAAIEAVSPAIGMTGYAVFLAGGRVLNLPRVTKATMESALREAGWIDRERTK